MVAGLGAKRSFLFLQGLATLYFVRLAREIASRGHAVHRINLCGGDRIFWPRLGATDFRGRFCDWRSFLGTFLHENDVTDIVLFGDCRPYHRVAADLARSRGIAIHVFEEGYFRPDWITLEKGGTNGYSSLPRDVTSVLAQAEADPHAEVAPQLVGGGFTRRIIWELLNQVSTLLMSPWYRYYRRHRAHHPLTEFGGWIKRLAKRPFERRYTRRVSHYVTQPKRQFYLLPLQLETDYQIRRHSPFKSMAEVMDLVMASFGERAPKHSLLVIKLHPLDNGLVNFRKQANRIARRLNLRGRVFVIDGGHLPTLLGKCRGVVVVNSTTGLSALHHNRPLKALGRALFDLPGLTFQGPLDEFWRELPRPDQDLFRAFRRVVLRGAQVNGSFFTKAGMALAIEGAVERLGVAPAPSHATSTARAELDEAPLPAVMLRQ
jgi:capsular polysaccharide export protein